MKNVIEQNKNDSKNGMYKSPDVEEDMGEYEEEEEEHLD